MNAAGLPPVGQMLAFFVSPAQMLSQLLLQQNESALQTAVAQLLLAPL